MKDPLQELADYYEERANYHRKKANFWLAVNFSCLVAIVIIIFI